MQLERDEIIKAMRSEGCTLELIGRVFGLTRERIRVLTQGVTPKKLKKEKTLARYVATEAVIRACLVNGLSKRTVSDAFNRDVTWYDDPALQGSHLYSPFDRTLITAFLLGQGKTGPEISKILSLAKFDSFVNKTDNRLRSLGFESHRKDCRAKDLREVKKLS
jgi:DNA-binding CsgD family transcriptional regulator